jgi:hypothetical protein
MPKVDGIAPGATIKTKPAVNVATAWKFPFAVCGAIFFTHTTAYFLELIKCGIANVTVEGVDYIGVCGLLTQCEDIVN